MDAADAAAIMAPQAQHAAADASYEASAVGFGAVDTHEVPSQDAKRRRF